MGLGDDGVGRSSVCSSTSSIVVVEGSSSVGIVVIVVAIAEVALDHLPLPISQEGRFRVDRDWGRDRRSDEDGRGFGRCLVHDVPSVVAFLLPLLLGLSKFERVELLPERFVYFGAVESDDELRVGRGRLVRRREFGGGED